MWENPADARIFFFGFVRKLRLRLTSVDLSEALIAVVFTISYCRSRGHRRTFGNPAADCECSGFPLDFAGLCRDQSGASALDSTWLSRSL